MNVLNRLRRYKGVRYVKVTLAVCACILAVAVVTTVMVDLGPAVRRNAETLGTRTWKRPVRIGKLSIRLLTGHIVVDDFSIAGLEPTDRPFFTAKRLEVALDWSTALRREIAISSVEMTDWQMVVEKLDNRTNFPKFTRDDSEPRGPRRLPRR